MLEKEKLIVMKQLVLIEQRITKKSLETNKISETINQYPKLNYSVYSL